MKQGLLCRYLSYLLTIAALFFSYAYGNAAYASGITSAMRQEDPRLEKRVTVFLPAATLAKVADEITQQSGVTVSVAPSLRQETDPLRVCVLLRNVPLGSALDSLCSLFSYKSATWNWHREGQKTYPNTFRYTLYPSSNASMAAIESRIRGEAQAEFETQDASLKAALALSPDRLKELAKTNSDAAYLVSSNAEVAKRNRGGLKAFFSLSPEQRLQVMRGQPTTMPIDSLPAEGVEFAQAELGRSQSNSPAPRTVTFWSDSLGLTPCLRIGVGNSGAINYIGNGLNENVWRGRVAGQWLLRDDSAEENAAEKSIIEHAEKPATLPERRDANSPEAVTADLQTLLVRTSEGAPVSILAVLPPPKPDVIASLMQLTREPYIGQSLGSLLTRMGKLPYVQLHHKWRNGILLIRDASEPFR